MSKQPKYRLITLVFMAGLQVAILCPGALAQANAGSDQKNGRPPSQKTVTDEELQEQPVEEEEAAPAAVQIDVSQNSPLIKTLYQATRETKEKAILAKFDEAKTLIDGGADVKAVDAQGRTALHWAVFGSSYNTKATILVAYEEIADDLVGRGIEINREDKYNDTALDYLLYSPNFEMQTLLIEHGASSGFLAAFYHFFNDQAQSGMPGTFSEAVAASRKADLAPGLTLSVRIDGPVYSDRSRTGDPVTATVTYPLCKGGENIACKEGELLVPPGTKVNEPYSLRRKPQVSTVVREWCWISPISFTATGRLRRSTRAYSMSITRARPYATMRFWE